jgi:DNA ligase-1
MYKYKNFKDIDAKIIGVTSEKNNPKKLGALILKWKGITFNARPAWTDEEKAELFKNKDKYIGRLATVRYQNLDELTGAPRFGVVHGIRAEGDIK